MADQGAQLAQQQIQLLFQTAGLILDVGNTIADTTIKAISPLDSDPYFRELKSLIKNGECDVSKMCQRSNETLKEFEKRVADTKERLKESGCFFHVQKRNGEYDFITLTRERESVANALLNAGERQPSNYEMSLLSGDKGKEFITNDKEMAYMFQLRCRQNRIPVQIVPIKENFPDEKETYKIRFTEKDLEKMNAIRRNVVIDMHDEASEIRRAQIRFEAESINNNLNDALGYEDKESYYLVGRNGKVAKIEQNSIVFMDKKIQDGISYDSRLLRTNNSFEEKSREWILLMGPTTKLTEEQYKQYLEAENKRDFLIDAEREQGRPVISNDEKELLKKAESNRAKIEEKLLQDHPEEIVVDLNDYNNEESINTFKSNEKIDYEASHDNSESGYIDPSFLNDARAANNGLFAQDMEVPFSADAILDEIFNDELESEIDEPDFDKDLEPEEPDINE